MSAFFVLKWRHDFSIGFPASALLRRSSAKAQRGTRSEAQHETRNSELTTRNPLPETEAAFPKV